MTARHSDHDALAAALPAADQLGWLPSAVSVEQDHDLTTRLGTVDCSRSRSFVPSREASATNRQYVTGQESVASITFYDVETVDDARQFIAGVNALIACPTPPIAEVTFQEVQIGNPTQCEEVVVIRTQQPVSETIDAWCRVANLIGWIRLYPSGVIGSEVDPAAPSPVPPTDEQAVQTLLVTGEALRAAWNVAT